MARRTFIVACALLGITTGPAKAGIEDWEVNEVLTQLGGDRGVRYVELANLPGGCLFPSSRVVVYDAAGVALDSVNLVNVARCFGAPTYFLLATSAAAAQLSVGTDLSAAPQIPTDAAQVCFVSSVTHYDCVRFGTISDPVVDFFGTGDMTSVTAAPDGQSLSRVDSTHVVADDWLSQAPTPRGPNDGSPWFPPDAGPTPDAAPPPDAPVDAGPQPDAFDPPDAKPRADANRQRYLDVDPGGGAVCSCAHAGRGQAPSVLLILAAIAAVTGRGRRAGRPSRPGPRASRRRP